MEPENENVAICNSSDSDHVEKFVPLDKFTQDFQDMYNQGNIWGVYYIESGEIVAQDIWQDIHENILIGT